MTKTSKFPIVDWLEELAAQEKERVKRTKFIRAAEERARLDDMSKALGASTCVPVSVSGGVGLSPMIFPRVPTVKRVKFGKYMIRGDALPLPIKIKTALPYVLSGRYDAYLVAISTDRSPDGLCIARVYENIDGHYFIVKRGDFDIVNPFV